MKPSIYKRPDKPLRVRNRKRRDFTMSISKPEVQEPIMVDRSSECHVTPPDVAIRMVDYLDASPDQMTLEPSAGTGNLIQALLDSGHSHRGIVPVELNHTLATKLYARFKINVIHECFLEYAKRSSQVEFSRVIMNPPFSKVKQHVNAALSLMGNDGHSTQVLVALVPITFEHPEQKIMEILPPTTFSTAKVHTKIIRIIREK